MYIVIVGAGDIGSQLLELTTQESHDVVVVENDETIATEVARNYDCLVLNMDATTMDALEEAGGDRVDAIINTTESDATNVMVMLLAQELDIPSQVSVVHDPEHTSLFRQLGVNVVENPERLIAEQLYRAVQRPSVEDFVHLSGNAEIFEVTVGERSRIAGRSLAAADGSDILPDDVRVVAIERNCSVLLPQGETEIRTGDVVTVFSERGFDSEIIDVFVGENAPVSQRKQQT